MKKFFTLFLLTALTGIFAQAQNMVPNPGFETYFNLPSGEGDIYEAVGWANLNGGTVYPNATPDYFHSGGTNGTATPATYAGDVMPYEGNALAGFITYNFFVPNFREYIGIPLNTEVQVGKSYQVTFWLSNSQGTSYGSQGTNNIGLAFTNGAPVQTVNQPINLIPQIELNQTTYHNNWVQYSFIFTPTSNFDFLTIGNFRNDANTTRSTFATGFNLAYYFLDMISVQEMSALPIEDLYLAQTGETSGIELEWRFPANGVDGEWVLERSSDQVSFKGVETYKSEAGSLTGATGTYFDETAYANLQYFYRMRHVSPDGDIEFSDAIAARFEGEKEFYAGTVFPNPVADRFSLEFASEEGGEMQVEIVDQLGKVIKTETRNIELGEQAIDFSFEEDLPDGIYIATFVFQGERFSRRIMAAGSI